MKILKRLTNIFLAFFLVFTFGVVGAMGEILRIAAPDSCSRESYYVAERRSPSKIYVEEKNAGTDQKIRGTYIERVRLGDYVIYYCTAKHRHITHIIQAADPNHYMVGICYAGGQIIPILDISRASSVCPWRVKSIHLLGRVGLPSPEVYIEKVSDGSYVIKSAVTTPDIDEGEVYNRVTSTGDFDDFTDIVSFLAAFLLK